MIEILITSGLYVAGMALVSYGFTKTIRSQHKTIDSLQDKVKSLGSDKRSLETLYGFAVENLTPYLESMKDYDPKKFRQMGQPVDFIYWGDEYIEVIEVKSGNAKLSASQRKIRDQIKDGKVIFKEVRVKR
jgi:predicted Holliday junction resolvase-like endonuclease